MPLLRPEARTEVWRVTDATRKLVRAPASRCARRYTAAHVERDGTHGARRHHVQQHLALVVVSPFVILAVPLILPGYVVLGQPKPAPMLSPARGGVKVRRVDEREAAEVLCRNSGEERVWRGGRGEVERSCELRGIAGSGEERQGERTARGRNMRVRRGRPRECQ